MKFPYKYIVKRSGFWSNSFLSNFVGWDFILRFVIHVDSLVLRQSQYLPNIEIEDNQIFRIKNLLSMICQHNFFWRNRFKKAGFDQAFLKNLSDLEKIPILIKNEIKNNLSDFLNSNYAGEYYADHTSGSSGTPFSFYIDEGYILRSFSFCQRIFEWAGWQLDDKIVRFGIRDRMGFTRDYICYPCRVAINDIEDEYERRLDDLVVLNREHKLLIFSYGSVLLKLAKLITKNKIKLNLRSIVYSGDSLMPAEKADLENIFGCQLFNCYACRDVGWLAQECEKGNLHINSEWCRVEIVDDDGKNVPAGQEGRIVVIVFDNEILPFIRYDTGDIGRIPDKRCECGRSLPILEFQGRASEILKLLQGRQVSQVEFSSFFEGWYKFIDSYKVVQEKVDFISVSVVLRNPADFKKEEFQKHLSEFLGSGIEIQVNYPDKIKLQDKRKLIVPITIN